MASKIIMTPVLYGEEAKRFLKEIDQVERFKSLKSEAELAQMKEKAIRIWRKYHESR